MAKKELNPAKGWKSNKALEEILKDGSSSEIAEYLKSPAFTDQDYISLKAGLYKDLAPADYGYWNNRDIKKALKNSPHSNKTNNDKAIDLAYGALKIKQDWNKKNPKNQIDLGDYLGAIHHQLKHEDLSSKKLHDILTNPEMMLPDRYSNKNEVPTSVLKNDNIEPEHLYKFIQAHPGSANEVIGHNKADERLHSFVLDNPENLKHVSSHNLEHYLSNKIKRDSEGTPIRGEDGEPQLDITPARAKTLVEHAHDKMYNDALHKTMAKMDPQDKKDFVDRKLGIKGGQPAGLESWRTNDDQTNAEAEGWNDWTKGPEYDPKLAQRLASSPHLSDEQADHIKRHGNFEEKYKLYHNKQVDPKHGAEMFKLWHDDAQHKGYDAEQLKDKYKEDKDDIYTLDDLSPDLINENDLYENVDSSTQDDYTFSDWVEDNKDVVREKVDLENDDHDSIDMALRDNHDWEEDHPKFDKELDGHYQTLLDNAEDGRIPLDKVKEWTGKDPKDLYINHLETDENNTISEDDLEAHAQEENPEKIDYANHDEYSIQDHPDYEDRYKEAAEEQKDRKIENDPWSFYDDFYEDYQNSTPYQERWQEYMREAKHEAAKEHFDELYTTSHQDDRFVPEHLHDHIPGFNDLKAQRKKAIGEPVDYLNNVIPQRSYEHEYGDEQHLHELLKDYSDANGGSIDIGRMHKLMPAQGEVWKKIFGQKGKLTSDEIQAKTDAIPKTKYNISYGKWDGNKMQNINNRDQVIFRLDHSADSLKPLQEDPDLYETFKKIQDVSRHSGHPTKEDTIAWARVDATDPNHWMIDEVQSDFGSTVRKYLEDNGRADQAKHVDKIAQIHKDWRETLMNHVIKEAKKHGATKISTHSPDAKASHTGAGKVHSVYADSYKKVPRKMGFKPAKATDLPLTEASLENTYNKNPKSAWDDNIESHTQGWNEHKSWANAYNELAEKMPLNPQFKQYAEHHENLANQHRDRALHYGALHDSVSVFPVVPSGSSMLAEANEHVNNGTKETFHQDKKLAEPLPAQGSKEPDYHEGHTLNLKPNLVKAMIDIAEDLVKFEIIFENATDSEIRKRAATNINLIKHMLGYEPDLSQWHNRKRMFIEKNEDQLPKEPVVIKKCNCGVHLTTHNAEFIGFQNTSERMPYNLQLFNCPSCKTTVTLKVPKADQGLQKAVKTPSPHIGLNRLKQIKQDHAQGAGGQEYDEGELNDAIIDRSNSHAERMVKDHVKQEKQRALDMENQAKGIGGASPEDYAWMFNKPKGFGAAKRTQQHNNKIRDLADKYASTKGLSLKHGGEAAKVDESRAKRIADAYHSAVHMPQDPAVQQSYKALIGETGEQFKHMLDSGLKISKIQPGQENPYKSSKDLFHDIHNNNHIWYFPTESGFGSDPSQGGDHPMLQPTEHVDSEGKPMLANDVFRIVHDYFGHAKEGHGFGAQGEENAWRNHMQMYTPEARKALTAETRGQNSWVNYGPHGENNRKNPANTIYADQKATLLPDWAMEHEGSNSAYSPFIKKSELGGKHLQRLDILMKAAPKKEAPIKAPKVAEPKVKAPKAAAKAPKVEEKIPKKIQLLEGRHKGKVVNVVGQHQDSSNPEKQGFRVKPLKGESPIRNVKGETLSGGAFWNKDRKHKVLGRGIKPDKVVNSNPWPTKPSLPSAHSTPPSPTTYSSDGYDDGRFENNLKGKLTNKHAHPHIPHSKEQLDLMHNIDLSKVEQQVKGWTGDMTLSGVGQNGKKIKSIVKGHMPMEDSGLSRDYDPDNGGVSTAQREALYHNLAHNVFGLGKYVPTTSVAEHNGNHYSVMQMIPGAEHYDGSPEHQAHFDKIKKSGDIQKLALMNVIMGNSDRHGGNYMVSPEGIHLIDHGLTFNYKYNGREVYDSPSYFEHAYPGKRTHDVSLHPDVKKWLHGISTKDVDNYLKTHNINPDMKQHFMGALQTAKDEAEYSHNLGELISHVMKHHRNNDGRDDD